MIVIKNRELLIPNNEQFIGTVYDNNADTRFFKIDRVLPGQIDLNNFTFVADVVYSFDGVEDYSSSETYAVGEFCKYSGHYYRCTTAITVAEAWNAAHWTVCSETDSISLTKDSVTDDFIVLRMSLPASVFTGHVGNMAIQVRCSDTAGRTWSTAPANMYIMDQISNPGAVTSSTTLTELQQTETAIEASEALRIAAETSRASAETGRVNAESARVIAENGRVSTEEARVLAESGRASAETSRANAETARGNAETGRSTAESGRVNAETDRVNAESARVLAETARETAEANREATLATKSLISEGYAKGTQNDVPVTSESTYYHNNSKYFSEESASKASTADAKRLVSEGYANGQQNGVDVGAGSPYYHNNAKYFMEQAGSASGFVSYAVDQQLPDGAKLIARNNIDSYKKPSSGIPSSDMASAVQTSLEKADSAYQKPASGIPSTDMASAVQTSLGKADTALQEHQSLASYRTSAAQDVIDAGKAAAVHNHDDRYYTESETDTLFEDKADRADVLPLINIWDEQWELGTYNASNGDKVPSDSRLRSANLTPVVPNAKYYIKGSFRIYYWDVNKTFISSPEYWWNDEEITIPSNCYYITFNFPVGYGTVYLNNISINYPSTYHGYYPSALPREIAERKNEDFMLAMDGFISPTINGIKNYWDGSLYHRRIARVDLGSLEWELWGGGYPNLFMANIVSGMKPNNTSNIMSVRHKSYEDASGSYSQNMVYTVSSSIVINDTSYTDALAFKQAMSGIFLYYELATEQTCNIDANGLRFELLWENASPSSEFSAQTVSLDLSKYTSVLCYFTFGAGNDSSYLVSEFALVGNSRYTLPNYYRSAYARRPFKALISGVNFDDNYLGSSVDNTKLIPYRIYGLR